MTNIEIVDFILPESLKRKLLGNTLRHTTRLVRHGGSCVIDDILCWSNSKEGSYYWLTVDGLVRKTYKK